MQQNIEILQKDLMTLEHKIAENIKQEGQLEAEAKRAFGVAQKSDDPAQLGIALHFEQAQGEKIEALRVSRAELEKKQGQVHEQVRALFAEQKRYEILEERRIATARAELLKKQQAEMDDLAQRRKDN